MRATLGLAAICALSFVLPAGAHHSHGNYTDTFKDIQGVVKEVHFIVPHSWVYIEVKDAPGRRSCGRSKRRAVAASNGLASRRSTSSRATPSRRAAIRCGTARTDVCWDS